MQAKQDSLRRNLGHFRCSPPTISLLLTPPSPTLTPPSPTLTHRTTLTRPTATHSPLPCNTQSIQPSPAGPRRRRKRSVCRPRSTLPPQYCRHRQRARQTANRSTSSRRAPRTRRPNARSETTDAPDTRAQMYPGVGTHIMYICTDPPRDINVHLSHCRTCYLHFMPQYNQHSTCNR